MKYVAAVRQAVRRPIICTASSVCALLLGTLNLEKGYVKKENAIEGVYNR
jgi:hypothetical protein